MIDVSDVEFSDPNDFDYVPETDGTGSGTDSNSKDSVILPYTGPNTGLIGSASISSSNLTIRSRTENSTASTFSSCNGSSYMIMCESKHASIVKHDENDATLVSRITAERVDEFHESSGSQLSKEVHKKHYCVFCGKYLTKLKRHIVSVHKDEKEVMIMMTSKSPSDHFVRMKNAGNHKHNLEVVRKGEGEIVVKKNSRKRLAKSDFVPCPNCLGYYYHRDLWRHKCPVPCDMKKRSLKREGRLLVNCQGGEERDSVQSIFEGMRLDKISMVVKNDALIKLFAQRECKLHFHDKDRHNHTRNKLRELGRLIVALREVTGKDHPLTHYICPGEYQHIVDATQIVAGFKNSVFTTPSIALKLGQSLARCASLLKAKAIEEGDSITRQNCEDFIQIYHSKWNEDISSVSLRSLREAKRNNIKAIPLSDDIALLSNHLNSESSKTKEKLENAKDTFEIKVNWERLEQITLTQIIMFNRRRQGEASKMTVEDYIRGKEQNHSKDILKNLPKFEKGLCEQLCRIEIVGKRGRTVPVILTSTMKEAIDTLLKFRDRVGIHEKNAYMFPRTNCGSLEHIRGSDCLREVVTEIPLQQPDLIRSTALRKHIATMTQLHNMKDNELDVLAQYMGHDIRIHREHYRLPSATVQVAKVAKFLISMENGHVLTEEEKNDDTICEDEDDATTEEVNQTQERESEAADSEDDEEWNPFNSGVETATPSSRARFKARNKTSATTRKNENPQRNMKGRTPWSDQEQAAVMKHLGNCMYLGTIPGKAVIENARKKDSLLAGRSWIQIKNFVRNKIVTKQKR